MKHRVIKCSCSKGSQGSLGGFLNSSVQSSTQRLSSTIACVSDMLKHDSRPVPTH